jgi:hypothetical protein
VWVVSELIQDEAFEATDRPVNRVHFVIGFVVLITGFSGTLLALRYLIQ